MQLQELIKNSEEQNQSPLNFEGEPPKDYILLREGNLWFVENLKTGHRRTITFGDKLEFYNNTECHKTNGDWIGTCMGEITSWTSAYVNIRYRENMYMYMMCENTKFYEYYPIQLGLEKATNNSKIIVWVLMSITVLYFFITLYLGIMNV